jgi:hypothetical protein
MSDDPQTLEEARVYVQEHLKGGIICPCCSQYAKVYKRKLGPTMAFGLCLIYRYFKTNPPEKGVHVAALMTLKQDSRVMGGDIIKLRFWGLITPHWSTDSKDESLGRWYITPLGEQFVEGKIAVPSHVYLYNGHVLKVSDAMTTIREALGDKFNYEGLMQ